MSDDFDWSTENPEVIQQSVQGVAVYENTAGNIVIRQERGWDEEEDSHILLTTDAARRLSEKLRELIQSKQMS